jgi:hypothetical protein
MSSVKKEATYRVLKTQLETLKVKSSWDQLITINHLIKLINDELGEKQEDSVEDLMCNLLWICE